MPQRFRLGVLTHVAGAGDLRRIYGSAFAWCALCALWQTFSRSEYNASWICQALRKRKQ